jgi:hypothetical protein
MTQFPPPLFVQSANLVVRSEQFGSAERSFQAYAVSIEVENRSEGAALASRKETTENDPHHQ